MISILEATETAPATAAAPKAATKARVGKQGAHVAPAKAKSAKKASPKKKAPKGAKKATGARDGSKAASILELLKRKDGDTLKDLMKATDWQAHSVRGFLSGTIRKKRLGRHVHQARGWRAHLLHQSLNPFLSTSLAPPGSHSAAFFVCVPSCPLPPWQGVVLLNRKALDELF
jgi:hypothetical protein